ncbi:MAG: AAA family ATPase [Thermoplasmata archaeon]|nr:AAA family ATPase [Thermoplasmata archaeon]
MDRKLTRILEDWKAGGCRIGLVVNGCGRVGKTLAVEGFALDAFDGYLRLDLSDPAVRGIFGGDIGADEVFGRIAGGFPGFEPVPGTLLFLDDVHLCPDAWAAIKPLVRDGRVAVVAACVCDPVIPWKDGRPARVTPMGYEIPHTLMPLDFEEFLWARKRDRRFTESIRRHVRDREPFGEAELHVLNGLMEEHMLIGGMPEMIASGVDASVSTRLRRGILEDVSEFAPEDIRGRAYDLVSASLDTCRPVVCGRKDRYILDWISCSGLGTVCRSISGRRLPELTEPDGQLRLYAVDTGLVIDRRDDGLLREGYAATMISRCGLPVFDTAVWDERCLITSIGGKTVAVDASADGMDADALHGMADRVVRLDGSDIHVDPDGTEHYPLFAAAFMDSMADEKRLPDVLETVPLDL